MGAEKLQSYGLISIYGGLFLLIILGMLTFNDYE